jgi:plasmid stabilization system protein ParE
MKVRALQAATDDLKSAADYLEAARSGTGGRLIAAYREVVRQLRIFPQLFSLVEDDFPPHEVRNAILERFYYRVIYLVKPDEAVILAVTHTSRRPEHWHGRPADPGI